ncbi:helix-turn-helix domain-containing protein [Nocardioides nitrophenolicus]|uniref:helix-turn-helix domain-containing protein n=1 Tax=Nocardioides nitrophenolicus TaxID=60489 RepID=UPI0019563790|nr:helix-turn-helix domain-containing protein [Nocardioides nitrophenolicus]MBM7516681.1 DNA-binding IclR family transcriptional regulator [Nocardioides nitrophenolicus]
MTERTPPQPGAPQFRGREPGALDHAFAILEEVARSGAGVSAREIAENLGLARATAYRLLKHLVQQEYLVRSPDLSGFALGQRVRDLAGAVGTPAEPELRG